MSQTVSDMLMKIMREKNIKKADIARHLGVTPAAVSGRFATNAWPAEVWMQVADFLGYDVVMQPKGSGASSPVRVRQGIGPRLRRMTGKIIYDTSKSDAVCHTPKQDGWFIEIYRDNEGRFFAAHYTDWVGAENFITPCEQDEAHRLYLAYGDGECDEFFIADEKMNTDE